MKYSIMLVSNNNWLCRFFKEEKNTFELGFYVVCVKEKGEEALEAAGFCDMDLVIADLGASSYIRSFASQMREIRPAAQIAVVSDEEIEDYPNIIALIKKSTLKEKLPFALFSIKSKMDSQREGVMRQEGGREENIKRLSAVEFLLPLMLGSFEKKPDDAMLSDRAKKLGIVPSDIKNPRLCVMVSKFLSENGEPCTEKAHTDFINNILSKYLISTSLFVFERTVTLAVIEGKKLSNALELPLRELVQSSEHLLSQKCTVGVSREFTRFSECSEAYLQAITARRYTADGSGPVRFIEDQEKADLGLERAEKTVLEFEAILKTGSMESLNKFINNLYETQTPENADFLIVQIMAAVYKTISAADKTELLSLVSENPMFARITSLSSENVMKNDLLSFCSKAKGIILKAQRRDSEVLCDKAVQIIDERFSDEELSLTSVSNELAVSPNYLSALIKKNKKKNFITLLTERRMRAAYDMLMCSNMKVFEIAQECGYSDHHYFSGCFKRFYGKSPTAIREKGIEKQ